MVCVTGAVARQITSDLNKELLLTPQKKLATDGNSDEDYKCFPILVRHVDKDSELIITRSLLVTSHVSIIESGSKQHSKCMCAMK